MPLQSRRAPKNVRLKEAQEELLSIVKHTDDSDPGARDAAFPPRAAQAVGDNDCEH